MYLFEKVSAALEICFTDYWTGDLAALRVCFGLASRARVHGVETFWTIHAWSSRGGDWGEAQC